jgi:hypothetical protein
MLNFSPLPMCQYTLNPMRSRAWSCTAILCLLVLCCMPAAPGQTLAHPGWVGSGLTPNVWWRHAFVYAVETQNGGGLKAVAARMDAMQALGVDAILLRGLQTGVTTVAINPAAGTMDDFDEVLVQASRHSLRVLVELTPKTATEDVTAIARFWLSRGVSGFRLVAAGDSSTRDSSARDSSARDSSVQMRQLRSVAKFYVGERVMIGDAALSSAPVATSFAVPFHRRHAAASTTDAPRTSKRSPQGPQLLLDASIAIAPLNVGAIRAALENNDALNRIGGAVPMLATADGAGGGPEFGRVVATLLLSTRGGAMVRAGQIAGSDTTPELSAWYKQMSTMQHSNSTVRTGINATLDHDAQKVVAWVRRPQVVSYRSPAIVFLCNMTDQPVTLSLRADMETLKLRGSFFRTLLRTDAGMGAMGLDTVKLAPYGVYVGELQY